MKVKVYLSDWFINAGIVGFLRILEHNHHEFAIKKDNYIEFDTEDFKNFDDYYFQYFFDKYNVAKRVQENTEKAFEYIQNNTQELENKEQEKQRKENVKTNKKYIKDIIKKQLDKIKKIDELTYNEMKEANDKLDKVETKEDIKQIKDSLITNIEKEDINKRLTLNLFKSILSKAYYGQNSFLNVIKTAWSYEDQKDLMYIDYVSNIVETGFLHDILDNKYSMEQIKEEMETRLINEKLTKEMQKIYEKIKKDYIQKEKTIEEIQSYLKEKVIHSCCMCENEFGLTTNFSEGHFVPLAISSDNARNFFWNQNVKFPICDICKLILFCIPAGITTISKTVKDKGVYKEEPKLSFVNYDTNVDTLLKTNEHFRDNSKYESKRENPYTQLLLNIIEQNQKMSYWQLENIFVVEFEAEYGAYSRMEYFNIKRYVAEFFTHYAEKSLNRIMDYKYKLQIVDYILKNKDIDSIINERLRDELKNDSPNGYHSFLATQVRMVLNLLREEKRDMEELNNKKLYALYKLGIEIHEQLKKEHAENKLDGYTYKMLNSVKSGNKKEFMDTIIRLHIAMGKDVSPIFIETMQDTGLDFESIGHSFLAGLISNKYEKKEEENKNGK